jgi:hypothetical protein
MNFVAHYGGPVAQTGDSSVSDRFWKLWQDAFLVAAAPHLAVSAPAVAAIKKVPLPRPPVQPSVSASSAVSIPGQDGPT